jgi:hypothetical protein
MIKLKKTKSTYGPLLNQEIRQDSLTLEIPQKLKDPLKVLYEQIIIFGIGYLS